MIRTVFSVRENFRDAEHVYTELWFRERDDEAATDWGSSLSFRRERTDATIEQVIDEMIVRLENTKAEFTRQKEAK